MTFAHSCQPLLTGPIPPLQLDLHSDSSTTVSHCHRGFHFSLNSLVSPFDVDHGCALLRKLSPTKFDPPRFSEPNYLINMLIISYRKQINLFLLSSCLNLHQKSTQLIDFIHSVVLYLPSSSLDNLGHRNT